MKRLFLTFLLFTVQLYAYNFKQLHCKLTPENTVFVFDMHDVVLNKMSGRKKIKLFFNHPDKSRFLQRLKTSGINPIGKSHEEADVAIEKEVIYDNDEESYVNSTLELINSFVPNEETLKFIQELHGRGFKIFGCSNLGQKSLEFLKSRYAELAELFNKCFCGFQGPTKENGFLTKQNPQTYRECKAMINKFVCNPEHIVFIDDSLLKIKVAEAAENFQGYQFVNANKLRSDLGRLL